MKVLERSGGLVAALFCLLTLLPFIAKPLHNDEPVFVAIGRHILAEPARPLGFDYYWFGRTLPMTRINTTPPAFHYLMALDQGAAGGREWFMRLVFLPFCLAAAWALHGLAGRFLERPLLPTLVVIANPAFVLNMGHVMPEAPSLGLGLLGLLAAVKGVDEGMGAEARDLAWYGGAALIGSSVLFKYNAALLIPAALCYGALSGLAWRKLIGFAVLSCAPAGLYLGWDLLSDRAFASRALEVTAESMSGWWSSHSHKARSLLAFIGGCGLVTAFWPYIIEARSGWRRWHLAAAACTALLFLPSWDLAPVRGVDRLTGFILSLGALLGLVRVVLSAGSIPGWRLWLPWLASAAFFQAFLYWSVMARTVLHLLPPLVFCLAAVLEPLMAGSSFRKLAWASLACVTLLTMGLGWVDYSYAAASKAFAAEMARERLAKGRAVYFTGAMGLQYYLEAAGGRGLEVTAGGWDRVKPGEAVVVLRINSVRSRPSKPRLADVTTRSLGHPVPLRLMSGFNGDGGFYSNLSGCLPYSLSREPLEEFSVVEMR